MFWSSTAAVDPPKTGGARSWQPPKQMLDGSAGFRPVQKDCCALLRCSSRVGTLNPLSQSHHRPDRSRLPANRFVRSSEPPRRPFDTRLRLRSAMLPCGASEPALEEPLLHHRRGAAQVQPEEVKATAGAGAGGDAGSHVRQLRADLDEAAAREAVREGALRFWQQAMAARQRANIEAGAVLQALEESGRAAAEVRPGAGLQSGQDLLWPSKYRLGLYAADASVHLRCASGSLAGPSLQQAQRPVRS